jgi:hypothetical protein
MSQILSHRKKNQNNHCLFCLVTKQDFIHGLGVIDTPSKTRDIFKRYFAKKNLTFTRLATVCEGQTNKALICIKHLQFFQLLSLVAVRPSSNTLSDIVIDTIRVFLTIAFSEGCNTLTKSVV